MISRLAITTVVLTLCCLSPQGWAAERFPFLGEISADKVSIRAGYHTNFERVDIVPKGTELMVVAKEYDWYKVQLPASAKAYVRVDYVKPLNNKVGQINAERLNIRAGRGVNFSPLGQLNKGTYVRLISKFDDWFQIEPVEGLYGWVSKDFIQMKSQVVPPLAELGIKPVESETAAPTPAASITTTSTGSGLSGYVTANGIIEAVPADSAPKNVQYQFTADDKTIYYLRIDPAAVKDFLRKTVRLEAEPVADMPSSIAHPLVVVKKFTLIL